MQYSYPLFADLHISESIQTNFSTNVLNFSEAVNVSANKCQFGFGELGEEEVVVEAFLCH